MKTISYSSKSTLLIQGFISGRLHILNLKTSKPLFNLRCVNDDSKITALTSTLSHNNDTLHVFAATNSGYLVHVIINSKETKLVKSKQIALEKIRSLQVLGEMLYVMTERKVMGVNFQSFGIEVKYELNC
jgi:hypothetical protein